MNTGFSLFVGKFAHKASFKKANAIFALLELAFFR